MLVGRGRERERIDQLLAGANSGRSGALVLRGEPGIGKSSLLRHAIEQATQWKVLWATGIETESELPFSGLAELFHPILDQLDEIPAPQAAALGGALAVGPPVVADPFTIYAATLSLIASAAERTPVLAVIDDAHWLDASSSDALLFAARRLHADRVVLLFAARTGERLLFDAPGVPELRLEGLNRAAAETLLTRGGRQPSQTVAERIHQATAGNPLAILEIREILSDSQLAGTDPLNEPLPVGPAIQRSFERQVAQLPAATQQALLVAAASQSGAVVEVVAACGHVSIERSAFEPAESRGLIRNDGLRIAFRHPLVRAASYQRASAPDRRAAHRALAAALNHERPPVERAWHLAAAADGPDEAVAQALEDAALEARRRSGHAAAARAFERAARLTPDSQECARRLREAGSDAHVAGETGKSIALLDEALQYVETNSERTEIEHSRARVEMWSRSPAAARALLLQAAARIQSTDPARAALILVDAATTCHQEGDPVEGVLGPALRISRQAYEMAAPAGGTAAAAAAGLYGKTLIVVGKKDKGYPLLLRGQQMIDETDSLWLAVQLIQCAVVFLWLEDYDRARGSLEQLIKRARAASAPGALPYPLGHLSEVDFRMGRWSAAYAGASEAVELARELGQSAALVYGLVCVAWIEAAQGRVNECRAHVTEALTMFGPLGITIQAYALRVLGLMALGIGEADEAITHLGPLQAVLETEQCVEQGVFQQTPDLIEAYVRTGRMTEARETLSRFQKRARQSQRTWALATAARCEGMLAETSFEAAFEEALEWHAQTPTPFERARTELCYGQRLRRARLRARAREHLQAALVTFEQLGAAPWAERARNELRATGETPGRPRPWSVERLTLQELQVALKVAEGATNREAATALFLSPKTIEAHLSRVYSKLGVRSRTELARYLAHEPAKVLSAVPSVF